MPFFFLVFKTILHLKLGLNRFYFYVRMLQIWDLASGRLKLTLTGHIEQVRGLCFPSFVGFFSLVITS